MDLSALMQISPMFAAKHFQNVVVRVFSVCFFFPVAVFQIEVVNQSYWWKSVDKQKVAIDDHHPSQCLAVICVYFGSVDVLPVINPIFFYRCAQFPLLRVWNVTVDQFLVIWMQMSLTWIANTFYKFMHFWHTHRKNTNPEVWTNLHNWRWSSTFCSGICCHWFGVNGVCGTGFGESGGVERGGVRYPYAPYASGRPEVS